VHEHSSSRGRRLSVGTGTAALSLGLCLCAGQLISTPAANAATGVVQAATQAKIRPTISTSVSTSNLQLGARVRVTAKLIDPSTGAVVTSGRVRLQAYRNGKWNNWSSQLLTSSGTVNLSAAPQISGYFRTQYLGSGHYLPQTGARVRVNVWASGAKVLAEAKRHTGALYKFGAAGPYRFDCSGFTQYVFRQVGVTLPRTADQQLRAATRISRSQARAGDLVFFLSGGYAYHVGIYLGNGKMVDSPRRGSSVTVRSIYSSNVAFARY
jgi:cell wall-associated NlpC family hydrolase